MPAPLISAIINNYNYGPYLGRAIDSALAQSGVAHEVIVVDDGSSDVSRAVIASYGDRVRAVLKPNGGQASAINAGVEESRGALLAFLDADDWWLPHKLASVAAAFAATPEAGLVYHRLQPTRNDGSLAFRAIPRTLCSGDLGPRMMRSGGVWPFPMTSAVALRRSAWDAIGPVPERFRISADAWLVGIAPLVARVIALPEVLGGYRIHGNSWYRAADDAAMLRKRMQHWAATVEETNAFLARTGRPARMRLADHLPYRLAQARLGGVDAGRRIGLLLAGLANRGEPHPLRRTRDALREAMGLRRQGIDAGVAR